MRLDWGLVATYSSSNSRRARSTRCESVRTTIPSAATVLHAVISFPMPTSTPHRRQAPYGVRPSSWHSVGTGMP